MVDVKVKSDRADDAMMSLVGTRQPFAELVVTQKNRGEGSQEDDLTWSDSSMWSSKVGAGHRSNNTH